MGNQAVALQSLTDQEVNFVSLFVESGDAKLSAINAGYDEKTASRAQSVLLAHAHIAWAVAVATRKRFARESPASLRTLAWLRDNSQSDKVRADCAKDILNRAGHVAPRVQGKDTETPMHEMSTDELKTLASRLEGELADRSKPVISATAAPQAEPTIDLIG